MQTRSVLLKSVDQIDNEMTSKSIFGRKRVSERLFISLAGSRMEGAFVWWRRNLTTQAKQPVVLRRTDGEIDLSKKISDAEPRGRGSENTEFHISLVQSREGSGWEQRATQAHFISCLRADKAWFTNCHIWLRKLIVAHLCCMW